MIRNVLPAFLASIVLFSLTVTAQVDEVSEATGLPIPIGTPVIYGQVSFNNFPRNQQKPIVWVYLMNGGFQIDKRQTNRGDYYYFLQRPVNGYTLMFEVAGREVGRVTLAAGISNRLRQDITIDWLSISGAERTPPPGVVYAGVKYDRDDSAQANFDLGMAAVKEGNNSAAIKHFQDVVNSDGKDFVAWMMLGTVLMTEKKINEARKAFATSLELRSDYLLTLINYGKLELAEKNFSQAEKLLVYAVELEPASAEANHILGETYLQAKRGSLAVGYLNKAIELAPIEKAEIHLRLAALYDGAKMKDRAVAEYKMFLDKVKGHPEENQIRKYISDNTQK